MKTLTTLTSVLILLGFSCAMAPAGSGSVAVEFGGRVTGSELGHGKGTRVFGYFIYEPGAPSGAQTMNAPNLVVEASDSTYFERSAYSFYLYNDWRLENPPYDPLFRDGFALEFYYPGGYGFFSLMSSNTTLFTNGLLPATLPDLEQFNAGRSMTLTVDQWQPYRSTLIEIDRLSVVPVVPDQPVIFGLGRRAGGISFRFLAEALKSYTVQISDSLPTASWTALTNIPPSTEQIVLINDLERRLERSGNRFYRVRRN